MWCFTQSAHAAPQTVASSTLHEWMCPLCKPVQVLTPREAQEEDEVLAAEQAAKPLPPPIYQDDNVELVGISCMQMPLYSFAACSACH